MIQVDGIITELNSQLTGVTVKKSASLAPRPEKESDLPAVYVHPSRNVRNGEQLIQQQFAVQIVEKEDEINGLWEQVQAALMAYQVDTHPTQYISGDIIDIDGDIVFWLDVYATNYRHNGVCG